MEYLQIVCKQFVWWEDSFWLILACYETQFYSNNSVFWTESDLRREPEDSFFKRGVISFLNKSGGINEKWELEVELAFHEGELTFDEKIY